MFSTKQLRLISFIVSVVFTLTTTPVPALAQRAYRPERSEIPDKDNREDERDRKKDWRERAHDRDDIRLSYRAPEAIRKPRPSTVTILFALPTNEDEYSNIFHRHVSASVRDEIDDVNEKLDDLEIDEADRSIDLGRFEQALSDDDSTYFILVGHNNAGNFRFTDGESHALQDLARKCTAHRKICIFISCNSRTFLSDGTAIGISSEVTLNHGADMAGKLASYIKERAPEETSLSQINEYLADIEGEGFSKEPLHSFYGGRDPCPRTGCWIDC